MKRTKRRVITTLQNTIHIRSYSLINPVNFQNARFSKTATAFNEKISKSYDLFQKIKSLGSYLKMLYLEFKVCFWIKKINFMGVLEKNTWVVHMFCWFWIYNLLRRNKTPNSWLIKPFKWLIWTLNISCVTTCMTICCRYTTQIYHVIDF